MNRAYWDDLAATYDEQIFSVLRSDDRGVMADHIARHADQGKTAADLGCGPGQITPLLAAQFGAVHACDISRGLLTQAREACYENDNVEFYRHDLSQPVDPPFAPVDFAVCVNVILSADLEVRERMWNSITASVGMGGTLLLVLPSHESALYANFRQLDWHVRTGLRGAEAMRRSATNESAVTQLEHGVREIDGVGTKHYLREEIIVQLADRGLHAEEFTKLTYDWETEFANPPAWLGTPHPWNWLVLARR